MSNNSVFDNLKSPLFTQLMNTYSSPGTVSPVESNSGKANNLYIATATNSVSFGLLGGHVTITIRIANQNAKKTIYVASISGGIGVPLNLLSSFTGNLNLIQGEQ